MKSLILNKLLNGRRERNDKNERRRMEGGETEAEWKGREGEGEGE